MVATPPFGISGETPIPMAARARQMTAQKWVETAINLAYKFQVDGSLLFEGIFDGDILYTAPSLTQARVRHQIKMNIDTPYLSCSCPHGVRRLPCPEVGAAILLLRQIERSALPANLRGQRQYESFGNWLETQGA